MNAVRHIPLVLALLSPIGLQAQTQYVNSSDSVEIKFHQSKWNLDRNLGDNGLLLDSIDKKLIYIEGDTIYRLIRVGVTGAASPEGSEKFNRYLSEKRAETLFDYFKPYEKLRSAEHTFEYKGRDWQRVLDMVEEDSAVPYREETIALLTAIISEKSKLGKDPGNALTRLKRLRGGKPYLYLYKHIFPRVRASRLVLDYQQRLSPKVAAEILENVVVSHIDSTENLTPDTIEKQPVVDEVAPYRQAKPFYMDVRTNMLYDALLLPNIGVDFYLGKGFSVGANWMYGWWSKNIDHFYWRAYGGELNCRWWPKARKQTADGKTPFRGHHFGLYAQIYTYDFELGKKGEIGGKPNGTLFDQPMWAAGVEYGYSLGIADRLSLDFSIGLGYTTGIYYTYNPRQTHYVWEGTHRRKFFGPTKLEIALVWLIGRGNTNRETPDTAPEQEGGDR